MKTLNVTFTDKQFKNLTIAKREMGEEGKSWHALIMSLVKVKIKKLKGGLENEKI